MSVLRLSYIEEDQDDDGEGTPDTWGWYIVDEDGGARAGPFSMRDEALAELETLRLNPAPSPQEPPPMSAETKPGREPEAMVLVPREPTEAMVDAGRIYGWDDPEHEGSCIGHPETRAAIYRAMVDAAPAFPASEAPFGETVRDALAELVDFVKNHKHAEGHCMCGAPMDDQAAHDDHTAIDMGEYYASHAIERAEAVLAASRIMRAGIGAIERVARALHISCSRQDILGYLNAKLNCTVLAQAALDAIAAPAADVIAGVRQDVHLPIYKAVERILDDHSAWVARPNDEVTKKIAFAVTVAAHRIVAEADEQEAAFSAAPSPAEPTPAGNGVREARETFIDRLRGELGAVMDETEDGSAFEDDPNFEDRVEGVLRAVLPFTRYADGPALATPVSAEEDGLRAAIAPIIVAVELHDSNAHGRSKGDETPIWIAIGDWKSTPLAAGPVVTLGDMRKIASAALSAKPAELCVHCDGTGDVHRADGEWMGECDCVEGRQARAASTIEALQHQAGRAEASRQWHKHKRHEAEARIASLEAALADQSRRVDEAAQAERIRPARLMTDDELDFEFDRRKAQFEAARDCEGCGGSPGEAAGERMEEIDAERQRRLSARAARGDDANG